MPSDLDLFLERAHQLDQANGGRIPACSEAIIDLADHALAGRTRPTPDRKLWVQIDLDGDIDWSGSDQYDPSGASMALLRFHVLGPLASAYLGTGDVKYATGARKWIERYLDDHTFEHPWEPAAYDRDTQYELRMGCCETVGWLGALPAFASGEQFDEAFIGRIFDACRVKLRYLSDNVRPDRNIRVTHGDVLLSNGWRLPFFPEAEGWQRQGARIINDAANRQVMPDGSHMEAVPGYHCIVMRLLHHMWRVGRALPELGLKIDTQRVARMYDYALCATRPDGALASIGDTPYTAATIEPIQSQQEARDAFRKEAGLDQADPPRTAHFHDAGQAFLRDRWSADATWLTFDASRRRSYHWHPACNAIQLFAHGRALLVDTGYPFKDADIGAYGSQTAQHSTVNFNGLNQSPTHAPLRVDESDRYALVQGHYEAGYWATENETFDAGVYGRHHRMLLWIRGRAVVILDNIYAPQAEQHKPDIETVWQFSEGSLTLDADHARAYTQHDRGNLLMLMPLTLANAQMHVHEGERDPVRGWVPLHRGVKHAPAAMLRIVAPKHDVWSGHAATVLAPFESGDPPRLEAQAWSPSSDFGGRGAGRIELTFPDGSRDEIVWTVKLEHAIDQQHGLDTDASLVHLQFDAQDGMTQGLAVGGDYLHAEDVGGGDLMPRVERMDSRG